MANFSEKLNKRISETVLSAVVIISLFLSMTSVQAVDRAASDLVEAASNLSIPGSINLPSTGFPVSEDREPRYVVNARISFYSSDVFQTDDSPCIPADGSDLCLMAEEGVVDGVAANFLPLGTLVRFPETEIDDVILPTKNFVVRDRMNARYNGTRYVDIYVAVLDEDGNLDKVASKAKARSLGVKYVKMEVF